MGFMDKAKKLAEQAQEKLDEAQKNFNKPEAEQSGQGVRYDEHGRPIQEETPAAAAPPPAAEPAEPPPAEGAPSPPPAADPTAGDANATPDPFKPLQ
jgi:hypothetical protein